MVLLIGLVLLFHLCSKIGPTLEEEKKLGKSPARNRVGPK